MIDQRGPAEARLLHVERGLEVLDREIRRDQRDLVALSQGIWAEWGEASSPGMVAPMAPTTFSGTVNGCTGGLSGITVVVTNHATSALLATVTSTSGGAFSGMVSISGTVSVDFTGSGTHWTTTVDNVSMTAGTSVSGVAVNLTAATGYVCTFGCNEPVNKTLTVTDSKFAAFTANYAGRLSGQDTWQTTGATITYTGDVGAGCAASANVPVTYTLTNGGTWASKTTYVAVSLFNSCPLAAGAAAATSTHVFGSVACPPGFSVAFTNAAAQRLYSHAAAATYTITWTG